MTTDQSSKETTKPTATKKLTLSRFTELELAKEEEEFEEALGLLSSTDFLEEGPFLPLEQQQQPGSPSSSSSSRFYNKNNNNGQNNSFRRTKPGKACIWWSFTIGAVFVGVNLLIAMEPTTQSSSSSGILTFTCPNGDGNRTTTIPLPENYDPVFEEDYVQVSSKLTHNMTEYWNEFHNSKEIFDDWGKSYDTFKLNVYDWKVNQFVPYIQQSGSYIYESACGVGLNLYMTLEILHEVNGVEGVVVYGNEYIDASTVKANEVYDEIPPYGAQKGTICTADSSNLSYVPSNVFDLVFTGYLSTLLDPLHFEKKDLDHDMKMYEKICQPENINHSWAEKKLQDIAQARQEEWFGKWVAQMTRIAKPGAPVIVESVSVPLCDNFDDWGGVTQEWWKDSIIDNRFGWDVDLSSLVFGRDLNFPRRYHVSMRRNI